MGGPPVVVISDSFWRSRFNADPASSAGRSSCRARAGRSSASCRHRSRTHPQRRKRGSRRRCPRCCCRRGRRDSLPRSDGSSQASPSSRRRPISPRSRRGSANSFRKPTRAGAPSLVPVRGSAGRRRPAIAVATGRRRRVHAARGVRQRRLSTPRGRGAARARSRGPFRARRLASDGRPSAADRRARPRAPRIGTRPRRRAMGHGAPPRRRRRCRAFRTCASTCDSRRSRSALGC